MTRAASIEDRSPYDSIFILAEAAIEAAFVLADRCSDTGHSERRSARATLVGPVCAATGGAETAGSAPSGGSR